MIYLDTDNGTWGDSELLILVDDSEWTNEDYEEMHNWNDSMIIEYGRMVNDERWHDEDFVSDEGFVSTAPFYMGLKLPTPKQWAEQDYSNPFDKTE